MAYWKSNLSRLMSRVEFESKRRDWTQDRISKATGLRQPTISEWMQTDSQFKRLDAAVVTKLLTFLNRYFVCEQDDLVSFITEPGEDAEAGQLSGLAVAVAD